MRRSTTTEGCFKTCLVYKLFHPSITRDIHLLYTRQPAITRLTENSPPSPCQPILQQPAPRWTPKLDPGKASLGLLRARTQARLPSGFSGLSHLPRFHLLPLKPTPDIALAEVASRRATSVWCTYLREHVLLPSYMAGEISCFHTSPCQP